MVGPVQRVLRDGGAGLGGGDAGASAVLGKLQILLVEPGDLLSRSHAIAHIDEALHDLARYAKAKLAFDARRDHARIGQGPFGGRGLDDGGLHGAHRLLRHLLLTARSKRQRKQAGGEQAQPGIDE